MADPVTLTSEQFERAMASIGPGQKPDVVKVGGITYQVMPDGTGREVVGIPHEAAKDDTSPTTIHVPGKGWLQYSPAAGGWGLIPGSAETPDAIKPTVIDGEGGRKYTLTTGADGTPTAVPIAGLTLAPAKTQAQIDAESAATITNTQATTAHTNAVVNNMESPADAHTRRLAEIAATARAQGQAAIDAKKALVASGLEMTAQDAAELKAQLDEIAAVAAGQRAQMQTQFEHDVAQPNVQAGLDIQKQNANTSATQAENQRLSQEQQAAQANRNQQTDVLKTQAAAGSDFINQGIKLGVSTSMSGVHQALDPLMNALQLGRQAAAAGKIPQTAIPTPSAPLPVQAAPGPPGAPLPAVAPPVVAPVPIASGPTFQRGAF